MCTVSGVLSFASIKIKSVQTVEIEANFWLLRDRMRLPLTARHGPGKLIFANLCNVSLLWVTLKHDRTCNSFEGVRIARRTGGGV